MDYQKIYNSIINKRKDDPASKYGYYEKHHIIPKSLGGNDTKDNLAELTAREHFITHWLLVKIHGNNITNHSKMIYAFNRMCSSSDNQNRYYSRNYEIARKLFVENHPCKNDVVKNKISNSLKSYYSKNKNPDKNMETRFCECGRGESFYVKTYSPKRFAGRHALRVRDTSKMKETLRATLKNMTDDDKIKRLENSLMKNREDVGNKISLSKKGITTNQKFLDEIRYGEMNEDEFELYIKDRTNIVRNRMINRKKSYTDNIRRDENYYKKS